MSEDDGGASSDPFACYLAPNIAHSDDIDGFLIHAYSQHLGTNDCLAAAEEAVDFRYAAGQRKGECWVMSVCMSAYSALEKVEGMREEGRV